MNSGIMGVAYKKAKRYGRKVIGILPKRYKSDLKELESDEVMITQCVNQRTNLLVEHSDCLIVLPGGMATLYELLSFIEMKRCHEFDKPIIVYNETGYFDEFFDFFVKKIFGEKFTGRIAVTKKFKTAKNTNEFLDTIKDECLKALFFICIRHI